MCERLVGRAGVRRGGSCGVEAAGFATLIAGSRYGSRRGRRGVGGMAGRDDSAGSAVMRGG